MEINWFTFFAQIVNFLILIAVLQRFLYNPIIQAMGRREKTIGDRLQQAEQKRQEAQQEVQRYQQMQQELANQRSVMLAQVKADVEQTQKELMQNVRAEVEQTQSRWQEVIQRQKDAFLRELRYRIAQQIQATIRLVLQDLADVDLEQQIIQVFIERIQNLDEEEKQAFFVDLTSTPDAKQVVVCSAFEIPEESRLLIQQIIREQMLDDVNFQFEMTPDLICGVELKASGRKLAWSVENYLDTFADNLTAVFEEETGGKR